MQTTTTLKELETEVQEFVQQVQQEWAMLPLDVLNWKENKDSWSMLECIGHLNRYCRYYHAEIQDGMKRTDPNPQEKLKLSFMGKKSIQMIMDNMKPMKTFKRMNPSEEPESSGMEKSVLDEFLQHQVVLLELLRKGAKVNLNPKRVRLEFMKFMKLRLGETLLFIVKHQKRHMAQAARALQKATA